MNNQNHISALFLGCLFGYLMLLCPTLSRAQRLLPDAQEEMQKDTLCLDSVEISLLTCEPFDEIYALYGHTGLRILTRGNNGTDIVANWGVFDMSQSFFVVRFAFGITDYRMAFEPFDSFCMRYQYFGSGVHEQVLNLTNAEKQRVLQAINENSQPENIYYRYNFYFDNCTTRARDIIFQSLDGKVEYTSKYEPMTFREGIHQFTVGHEWMEWGQDFLLGIGSDREMTRSESQFLPQNMLHDFDNAVIVGPDGKRKLVKESCDPVSPMHKQSKSSPLTSPIMVVILLILITAIVKWVEYRRGHSLWQFALIPLLLSGIPGFILFCMLFSQHPTVSLNLQILVYNPLALVFLWPIIKHLRRDESCWQMAVLALCALAGLFGAIVQHYSSGTWLLALYLSAYYIHYIIQFKKKTSSEKK